ncbi:MAG: ROK family protein [Tropicimonas sp.]|uniref:ROK family protein n=1 Tax=Tropicimonas sp. TaxID=2067044 RepID=UPI003A8B85C6
MSREAHNVVLSLDIGGTKTMVASVSGDTVLEARTVETDPQQGPGHWIAQARELAQDLPGTPTRVAAAVTGRVRDGRWSALNPATLDIPAEYPLGQRLAEAFGLPAFAVNDAQAAAWAEFRYGAGQGKDMVFLTVSTGIGGGIIADGRLLSGAHGLAGHFGITGNETAERFEDRVSGRWMAAQAAVHVGPGADARLVFAEAAAGRDWAEAIIERSAERMARMLANIQLILDPDLQIIGGGIGLAPGYLERIAARLAHLPPHLRPTLAAARIGPQAGILGAAALAIPQT